jgi:hypothetical protein
MPKNITAYPKKKRRLTAKDRDRIETERIRIMDQYKKVMKLRGVFETFWRVWFLSGETMKNQIQMLRDITKQHWNASRYRRIRKQLFDILWDD